MFNPFEAIFVIAEGIVDAINENEELARKEWQKNDELEQKKRRRNRNGCIGNDGRLPHKPREKTLTNGDVFRMGGVLSESFFNLSPLTPN